MDQTLNPNFKPSPELLNLRKIQVELAKQKDYAEAHKVQVKVHKMEKEEQERWENTRMQKIAAAEQQLIVKQQNEMKALKKKIESGTKEQEKSRAKELERLLQRYQNIKKELDNQP